jgi:HSP20 family protein
MAGISFSPAAVSGKREEERKEEEGQYYTYERKHGSFTRSFTLPEGVDLESLTADLKNGELSSVHA